MNKKKVIIVVVVLLAAFSVWYFFIRNATGSSRPALQDWAAKHNDQNWINAAANMTDAEANTAWYLLRTYFIPANPPSITPADQQAWTQITQKYNVS